MRLVTGVRRKVASLSKWGKSMRDGATKMLVDVAVTSALQDVGWIKPAWMPAACKSNPLFIVSKLVTSQTSNLQEDHVHLSVITL
jgi:hypothetical protein